MIRNFIRSIGRKSGHVERETKFKHPATFNGEWEPERPQEWVMKKAGEARVRHGTTSRFAYELEWVREGSKGRVRKPAEKRQEFSRQESFMAAGRQYAGLDELTVIQRKDSVCAWYKDCYGRKIFYVEERFPCFDSSDFLYEDRYYRWYFICENGRLTRVYAEDEKPVIYVTEDVAALEVQCWEKMEKGGYLEYR